MYRITPLSSSFMLTSILGGIISVMYVFPRSKSWGFTFALFFVVMFIASLVSMTYSPLEAEIDVKKEKKRKVH